MKDKSTSGFITREGYKSSSQKPNITCYACSYDPTHYTENFSTENSILIPKEIKMSVTKRKAEFLAGRYAAKKTLLKYDIFDYKISIGRDRNPQWPGSYVGSITHTDDIAVCIVAKKIFYTAIGIDLENTIDLQTAENIKNTIIDRNENRIVTSCELPFNLAFTIAFSGKESLFKALYPEVGSYFDFDSAKIIQIKTQNTSFILKLEKTLSPAHPRGMLFQGFYKTIRKTHVFTSIILN